MVAKPLTGGQEEERIVSPQDPQGYQWDRKNKHHSGTPDKYSLHPGGKVSGTIHGCLDCESTSVTAYGHRTGGTDQERRRVPSRRGGRQRKTSI